MKKIIDEKEIEEPEMSYEDIVKEIANRKNSATNVDYNNKVRAPSNDTPAKNVEPRASNNRRPRFQNDKMSGDEAQAKTNRFNKNRKTFDNRNKSENVSAENAQTTKTPRARTNKVNKTDKAESATKKTNFVKNKPQTRSAKTAEVASSAKTNQQNAQQNAKITAKNTKSSAKTNKTATKSVKTAKTVSGNETNAPAQNQKQIRYFNNEEGKRQLASSRMAKRASSTKLARLSKVKEDDDEFDVPRDPNNLKVMFLGGVGEIGKNMTVLEYGDDIMVVDAGLSFPTESMPGIDVVVPDITYLVKNKDKVRGIVITHGHEDHIGGLPYTLNEIHCPIYGSKLTLALVQNKLREHPKVKAEYKVVEPHDVATLGCFKVEFLHVNHSIVGAYAVSITTPVGIVFHTGDFKIDNTPVDGVTTDLARMEEIGKQGVLLLLCESTNVEKPGHSMSESRVGESLNALFAENVGKRVFIATFASNIHRIQQITNLAEKYGRKVAFSGRSMIKNMEVAAELNELHYNTENVIDIDHICNYPDGELCIITTGSQGEPMSALTRIARGEFNKVEVTENDCFILSSSPIPGNEKAVNNTINALFKKGADVIYEYLMPVHVSGHGHYDELKKVHELLNPKYFIPVHGEYKHLKRHKDLALALGMDESNIKIAEIGDCIEVNKDVFKESGKVPSGARLIDGLGVGEIDSSVLKDRINLSEEGLCVIVVGIDKKKGIIRNGPEIITRGLIYSSEASSLVEEARQHVRDTINKCDLKSVDLQALKQVIRKSLSSFFNRKTRRNPTILTVVLEIR